MACRKGSGRPCSSLHLVGLRRSLSDVLRLRVHYRQKKSHHEFGWCVDFGRSASRADGGLSKGGDQRHDDSRAPRKDQTQVDIYPLHLDHPFRLWWDPATRSLDDWSRARVRSREMTHTPESGCRLNLGSIGASASGYGALPQHVRAPTLNCRRHPLGRNWPRGSRGPAPSERRR